MKVFLTTFLSLSNLAKWKKYFKLKHSHKHNTPICSRYVSFHTRDIIFECDCGERISKRIYREFSSPFPIETTSLITMRQFNLILNEKNDIKNPS